MRTQERGYEVDYPKMWLRAFIALSWAGEVVFSLSYICKQIWTINIKLLRIYYRRLNLASLNNPDHLFFLFHIITNIWFFSLFFHICKIGNHQKVTKKQRCKTIEVDVMTESGWVDLDRCCWGSVYGAAGPVLACWLECGGWARLSHGESWTRATTPSLHCVQCRYCR